MGKMICLCGLPGSGKTHYSMEFINNNPSWHYFSPEKYYELINGDECDRRNTFEVWHNMFKDIHESAVKGYNVIIDCDNLTYAQRTQWIEWFPEFKYKQLIVIDKPFKICIKRVNERKRKCAYRF